MWKHDDEATALEWFARVGIGLVRARLFSETTVTLTSGMFTLTSNPNRLFFLVTDIEFLPRSLEHLP